MALSSSHFGNIQIDQLFAIDALQGVGTRSSVWLIMEAFCRHTEGIASRLAFGPTGVLAMTTIPGDPNSGAFYFYDKEKMSFFSLTFERQESFNPADFDIVMTTYDLHLLIDRPAVVAKKTVQSHSENRNNGRRRRNRGRNRNNNQQVRIGTAAVAA